MYVAPENSWKEEKEMLVFMKANPFALMINCTMEGRPIATHLPVTIVEEPTKLVIHAHMALANEQARNIDGSRMLVVFSLPHAYISTEHYGRRNSVPTWNYIAVHAEGVARVIDEENEKLAILERLIKQSDEGYLPQWTMLDEAYRIGLLSEIVAFEMGIEKLTGSRKLSQDKKEEVRNKIANDLLACPHEAALLIGKEMLKDAKKNDC